MIPKKFQHYYEGSEPYIRLPSLGLIALGIPRESGLEGQQDEYRPSRGLGETETPGLDGIKKKLGYQDPEERSSDPRGD